MKSRLFIVEGVPCTGKTSTSEFISNILKKLGETVLNFQEGTSDHPADYNFHAYVTNEELDRFSDSEKEILLTDSSKINNGYVTSLSNIKGDLFNVKIKKSVQVHQRVER